MKEKELITFYKIFANLYGAILDKDAFEIITQYFPDFIYEDFISSLKKASKKHDRTYSVRKWDKDSYVIRSNINNKETRQLFFWQAKKPFFTCPNFEDFKKYVFYMNINKHTDPILKKISKLPIFEATALKYDIDVIVDKLRIAGELVNIDYNGLKICYMNEFLSKDIFIEFK